MCVCKLVCVDVHTRVYVLAVGARGVVRGEGESRLEDLVQLVLRRLHARFPAHVVHLVDAVVLDLPRHRARLATRLRRGRLRRDLVELPRRHVLGRGQAHYKGENHKLHRVGRVFGKEIWLAGAAEAAEWWVEIGKRVLFVLWISHERHRGREAKDAREGWVGM